MSFPLPVVARDLVVRRGRRSVLQGADVFVRAGEIVALGGSNGAGKSTLLQALLGLLRASGTARVMGRDALREGAALRAEVGWVPDELALPRWMRVRDALALHRALHPHWDAAEERRLLRLVELDPKQRVRALSRGQAKRLSIVLALAHRPGLVLLDEPFNGLDPTARRQVLAALLEGLRADGASALFASHALEEVRRIADRVLVLEAGRVHDLGAIEDGRDHHARVEVVLHEPKRPWLPPGNPTMERTSDGWVLAYFQWRDGYERMLVRDGRVRSMRHLPTDVATWIEAGQAEARREVAA